MEVPSHVLDVFMNKSPETARDIVGVEAGNRSKIVFDSKNRVMVSSSESDSLAHHVEV